MAAGDATAKFRIDLDTQGVGAGASSAGAELERLRQRIQGGSESIKQMSGSLRNLRGSTDDIKGAKEQLRAKIDAEKNAVSAATLAMLKQGTTYDKVTQQAKAAQKGHESFTGAMKAAGGPVASLAEHLDSLKSMLSSA